MACARLIYKGRVLSLFKEKKRLPNGRIANLETIRHPGAVLIIPFLDLSHIVFIRQFRPVINKTIYELPAGTINRNETPLDCARREIIEETGYGARAIRRLGVIYPVPGYSTEKIIIYRAGDLYEKFLPGDKDEIITRCLLNRLEVKKLFKAGVLKDAKTISALAFCGWL